MGTVLAACLCGGWAFVGRRAKLRLLPLYAGLSAVYPLIWVQAGTVGNAIMTTLQITAAIEIALRCCENVFLRRAAMTLGSSAVVGVIGAASLFPELRRQYNWISAQLLAWETVALLWMALQDFVRPLGAHPARRRALRLITLFAALQLATCAARELYHDWESWRLAGSLYIWAKCTLLNLWLLIEISHYWEGKEGVDLVEARLPTPPQQLPR